MRLPEAIHERVLRQKGQQRRQEHHARGEHDLDEEALVTLHELHQRDQAASRRHRNGAELLQVVV